MNNYFDSVSYDKPVKNYLDDTFYWTLLPAYTKKTNIYLKKNKLELSDTYLSGILPEEDQFFYQLENYRETLEPLVPTDQDLASIYLRFDH